MTIERNDKTVVIWEKSSTISREGRLGMIRASSVRHVMMRFACQHKSSISLAEDGKSIA